MKALEMVQNSSTDCLLSTSMLPSDQQARPVDTEAFEICSAFNKVNKGLL